jgi:hypothetical protein
VKAFEEDIQHGMIWSAGGPHKKTSGVAPPNAAHFVTRGMEEMASELRDENLGRMTGTIAENESNVVIDVGATQLVFFSRKT